MKKTKHRVARETSRELASATLIGVVGGDSSTDATTDFKSFKRGALEAN